MLDHQTKTNFTHPNIVIHDMVEKKSAAHNLAVVWSLQYFEKTSLPQSSLPSNSQRLWFDLTYTPTSLICASLRVLGYNATNLPKTACIFIDLFHPVRGGRRGWRERWTAVVKRLGREGVCPLDSMALWSTRKGFRVPTDFLWQNSRTFPGPNVFSRTLMCYKLNIFAVRLQKIENRDDC